MNKTIFFLLLMLMLTALFWADNESDKQKQLETKHKQIQDKEAQIAEKEAKKQQLQQEKQSTKKMKQQADKELNKSKAEAQEKLQVYNYVREELGTVEEQISGLNDLQARQMWNLVRLKHANEFTSATDTNQHLLSRMAVQTRKKLDDLGDKQVVLTEEKQLKGREFSLANNEFQEDLSLSKNLDTRVRSIDSQTSQLSKDQKKLQDQIAKLKKDAAQLESLLGQLTYQPGKEPQSYKFSAKTISWPLKGRIIREYGQETRSYGTSVVCNGIDIAAPEWTNVVAADAGTVVFSGTYGGQGKLLIIDHKNGFFTVYAYNNDLLVSSGATVKKGQVVAKSGMTGSATEPCLHFEVRKDGKAVNPLSYLD
jgi:murein hydrolase activator